MKEQHEDDDLLLAGLAEAWSEVGPLVDGVAATGRGVFPWRSVHDDLLLAELSFDSDQHPELATTRAASTKGADTRALVFSVPLRSVEIEVLCDRLVGQFVPPAAGTVRVEDEDGPGEPVEVDDLGFFMLEEVPRGLVRFHCAVADTRFVSGWVRL